MTGSSADNVSCLGAICDEIESFASEILPILKNEGFLVYTIRDIQAPNVKRHEGSYGFVNLQANHAFVRYQKRSRAAKGGGSAPVFRQEEIVLWIDKENWTNDLQLQ